MNAIRELSRILIEEYCCSHDTAKCRRPQKLAGVSCDITDEASDEDAVFLKRSIQREKDPEQRRALEGQGEFLFEYRKKAAIVDIILSGAICSCLHSGERYVDVQ